MKNAAPPTAATARMPTMITEAIRIDTHVGSFLVLIPIYLRILANRVHQAARLVGGAAVIIAVAQRDRGAQFFTGRRGFAGLLRELPKLEVRAAVHPLAPLGLKRFPQIRVGIGGPAQRAPRGAPLVVPERILAEHPLPRVRGETRKSLVECALGVGRAPRAQIRRAGLEPHEPIARIPLSQRA